MKMPTRTERIASGILPSSGNSVDRNRTTAAHRTAETQRRSTAHLQSRCAGGDFVHSSNGSGLEHAPGRTGLRQWRQLLATPPGLDSRRCVGRGPSTVAAGTWESRPDRSLTRHCRQPVCPRGFWGEHTGPNPTDRRKNGCKRHVIVDATGLPLAIHTTPANVHDSLPAMALLDAIPPCAGTSGRPRARPDIFQGDHAYGTPTNFDGARARGITPQMQRLGQRKTTHGSGLGVFRYVVERTLVWLGRHRRLRLCYEKAPAHFQAFNILAAAIICARRLATLTRF